MRSDGVFAPQSQYEGPRRMTEQQKHFPEFYVTAPQPCPYRPGRQERKLFTHLTHEKPSGLIDNLLRGGFRRSQNIAYMPYCEGCQAVSYTHLTLPTTPYV